MILADSRSSKRDKDMRRQLLEAKESQMSLPSTDDARTQVFALISSMSQAERLKALLPCLDGVRVYGLH